MTKTPQRRTLLVIGLLLLASGTTSPARATDDPTCGGPMTPINAIQGAGDSSPLVGELVITEGVLTADFSGRDQLRGFYLQAAAPDENPATSEGLFVYGRLPAGIQRGELLRLRGSVKEYQGLTELEKPDLLARCGKIDIQPLALERPAAVDESLEGMLVTFTSALVVNDNYQLGRYGELVLGSARHFVPTELTADAADAKRIAASNQRDRIILDDGSRRQNPEDISYLSTPLSASHSVRLGGQVSGILAVIDQFKGEYKLQPLGPVTITPANPRPVPPEKAADNTRVVSMNLGNLFNGEGRTRRFPTQRGADTEKEYQRQLAKIVATIVQSEADILALNELENDGFGEHSAMADLVAALARAGRTFQPVEHGKRIGSDAITNALLYDPARVTAVGQPGVLTRGPFSRNSRPPLLQHFQASGQDSTVFAISVNHFKARTCRGARGDERDSGEGCWNATRRTASRLLLEWLDDRSDREVLLVGDLNAYRQEAPLQELQRAGFINLFGREPGYSYSYFGEVGRLDHALATPALAGCISATTWHSNADEPRVLDYNLEYQSADQQQRWYAADPWRAGDHDPLVLDIDWLACEQIGD